MPFSPEDSAIKVTPAVESHLNTLTSADEIRTYLASVAVDQHLATRDIYSPDVLIPTELASTAPKRFAQTITDYMGKKIIFEGASELDIARQANEYMREHFSQPVATTQQITGQPRNDRGQFKVESNQTAEGAAAQADLRLRIIRGETTVDQAVGEYLQSQGVPLEELRAQAQERQAERSAQSWADATEEFRSRHPEWQGGEANRNLIGQILSENNLVDAEDKLAAMEAAYNHARENGLLTVNPEVEAARKIREARNVEEIRSIAHGGGLFNR